LLMNKRCREFIFIKLNYYPPPLLLIEMDLHNLLNK
jgi:hypothetical protein